MNQERLMHVILSPVVTEKAQTAADKHRRIVFKVRKDANKRDIKAAVELLFKVKVHHVCTTVVKGKVKMFKGRLGKRSDWKKAYVKLEEGHDISFNDAG
jgi:large subunit ribosomal protein L23